MGIHQIGGAGAPHVKRDKKFVNRQNKNKASFFGPDILDPFVRVRVGKTGESQETEEVDDGGRNCIWEEKHKNKLTFEIENATDLAENPDALDILVTVLDKDLLDDDLIGFGRIKLSDFIMRFGAKQLTEVAVEVPVKSNNRFTGILHLAISTVHKDGNVPDGSRVPPFTLIVHVQHGEELTTPMTAIDDDDQSFAQFALYTFVLLAYMAGYSAFFHYWEKWSWSDGIYFSIVTFSTVGFGDLKPTSDGGKWFIIGTGLFGVGVGGVCLNNMLSYFIALYFRLVKGCRKASTRKKKKKASGGGTKVAPTDYHDDNIVHADTDALELALRQKRKATEGLKKNILKIVGMFLIVLVLWVLGALFFMQTEGWSLIDALYVCMVTILTIGYGDMSPTTEIGRLFCSVWLAVGFTFVARLISKVSETYINYRTKKLRAKILNSEVSKVTILNMDENGDGDLDRLEFLTNMMMMLGMCEREEIDAILRRYDVYEAHRNKGQTTLSSRKFSLEEEELRRARGTG